MIGQGKDSSSLVSLGMATFDSDEDLGVVNAPDSEGGRYKG